jgi:hypothetical protein
MQEGLGLGFPFSGRTERLVISIRTIAIATVSRQDQVFR